MDLRFGFAVYEYIVDVYFADFISKSIEDLKISPIATRCPEGGEYSCRRVVL
jgi:hypothetical protein